MESLKSESSHEGEYVVVKERILISTIAIIILFFISIRLDCNSHAITVQPSAPV